jgi:hypothetical protein
MDIAVGLPLFQHCWVYPTRIAKPPSDPPAQPNAPVSFFLVP